MTSPSLQALRVRDWFALQGDTTLRVDYPLTPQSLVLDVGGYQGDFAQALLDRYGCKIAIYEPIPAFADAIEARFKDEERVNVRAEGLAERTGDAELRLDADATGASAAGAPIVCKMVRASDAIAAVGDVALLKLNVEGAEYEILEDLIESGRIKQVRDVQVQFHDLSPDCYVRMLAIREGLSRTHRPTWMFSFVWENWTRRDDTDAQPAAVMLANDMLREHVMRLEDEVAKLKAQSAKRLNARVAKRWRRWFGQGT